MKKNHSFFLFVWILCSVMLAAQAGAKGSLVIMGGAINSSLDRVYQRFIELGGGLEHIRLAIIPAASVEPAVSGRESADDFISLGVPADRIRVFPISILDDPTTKDVDEAKWSAQRLRRGTGQGHARLHGGILRGRRPDPLQPDPQKGEWRGLAPAARAFARYTPTAR